MSHRLPRRQIHEKICSNGAAAFQQIFNTPRIDPCARCVPNYVPAGAGGDRLGHIGPGLPYTQEVRSHHYPTLQIHPKSV